MQVCGLQWQGSSVDRFRTFENDEEVHPQEDRELEPQSPPLKFKLPALCPSADCLSSQGAAQDRPDMRGHRRARSAHACKMHQTPERGEVFVTMLLHHDM